MKERAFTARDYRKYPKHLPKCLLWPSLVNPTPLKYSLVQQIFLEYLLRAPSVAGTSEQSLPSGSFHHSLEGQKANSLCDKQISHMTRCGAGEGGASRKRRAGYAGAVSRVFKEEGQGFTDNNNI